MASRDGVPPGATETYRSTELDRALAASRIVAAVGPIADLDRDRIGRALARARSVEHPRLALEPERDAHHWPYRTSVQPPIVDRSGPDDGDLGSLLTAIQARGSHEPLEVFVCDDHLVVEYSHGIGDGRLGLALLSALSGPDDPPADRALSAGLPLTAIWSALWRQFGRHPRRLVDAARLRSANKSVSPPATGVRRIENWTAAQRTTVAHMDAETAAQLRRWVSENNVTTPTTASVTVALWRAALRAEGVDTDERVMILIDCRRYLDARHHAEHGNFAVGIPIHLPPDAAPAEVTRRVRAVTGSGWPVAILGLAEIRSRLRPAATDHDSSVVTVDDRVRLSVSDLGRLTMFDDVTWRTDATPPTVVSYLEPDGPDAITMLVSELRGVRAFTASFCSAFIAPEIVDTALRRMCSDPIALLRPNPDTP